MTAHPDVALIDRAIAEHDVRALAEELGYATHVLTDGTIVCEPRPDPNHCELCRQAAEARDRTDQARAAAGGDKCHDCGEPLTALNRCQRVVNNPAGPLARPAFWIEFVCPVHYATSG